MTAKFFAILTHQGAAKLANATALGTKLDLTQLVVGDGGGTLPTPDPAQTKLKGEKRRAAINMLSVDPANPHQIIAEQVIPENEGGWWIREIGLFDKDGTLIAVANCPETYKPQLQEGSGRTQTIRMVLIVSSTEAVTLKIDPAVVLATRDYVDNAITAHAQSRNHPDATTAAKGLVQLSSATNSPSEALAATPKAVKSAYDLANNALSKTVVEDQTVASGVLFTKPIRLSTAANATGFIPASQGAWVSWNRKTSTDDGLTGATDFTNHKGMLNGGWNFWSTDGTAINLSTRINWDGSIKTMGGIISYTDQIMQAGTTTKNLLLRFRDAAGVEKGAIFSDTSTGNMTIRWNGTAYSMSCKADGTVTIPNTLFIGSTPVIKAGEYGIGGGALHQADALQAVSKVYRLTGASLNKPAAEQSYSAISMPMDGNAIPTVAYLFVSQTGKLRTGLSNAATGTGLTSYGIWGDYNTVVDTNGFLKSASHAAANANALVRTDFPVGIPQPWPTATAPEDWLKCNGAAFDKAKYPLLAVAYPSGKLPDLRGEFIRGADDGRGIDSGRAVLSTQADAVQKFTGKTNGIQHFTPGLTPQGIISQGETVASTSGLTETSGSTGNGVFRINIDASLQIRTATETRPRNIAFNYIVRAA